VSVLRTARGLDRLRGPVITFPLALPRTNPVDQVRSTWRALRPQQGAVANARDAVRADERSADQRRDAALLHARACGPSSWTPFELPASAAEQPSGHAVHFYDDEAALIAQLAAYVGAGLADGEICLVVASAAHLRGMHHSLALSRLSGPRGQGRLVALDADQALDGFMRESWPDPELFDVTVGRLVRDCLDEGLPVRGFAEMVGMLHARDQLAAAIQLEKLWETLHAEVAFPVLCAYPALGSEQEQADVRERVQARHTHLAGAVGR